MTIAMGIHQGKSVELSIRNQVGDIAIVVDTLDRIGKDWKISAKTLDQLQVVLDELLSNIVKYAWPAGEHHELQVHIRADNSDLKIVIIDDGKPFDPREHVPRERPEPGIRPTPGGVGIQMVRQLIDNLDYTRSNGRNEVTVTKRHALGQT